MRRRGLVLAAGAGLVLPRMALAAAAADWPERALRFVVAFPPGASTDVLMRAVAQRLTDQLGRPCVVENRPGAGGNLATALVAGGPPDGHAFLVHSTAFAVNPGLYRNAGYDPVRDFTPGAMLADTPNVLFVHRDVPAADLPQLLALMRGARPGMAYASSGTGTTPHLGAELLFRRLAGVEATHVAFGPAQAVTAVVAGQAPIGSTSLPPALGLIRSGEVRAIAVTGARRHPRLPDLPTVAEQGFPGFEASTWFAVLAPARAPGAIADRLHREIEAALATAELRERLEGMAFNATPAPRAELQQTIAREAAKWAEVVRLSGATAE
jgi:tripartite-type tricarboxylate transporter receptor subunit TctC